MAFDERGRLWVIEAIDYPNDVLNGNPGDDRIKILEDTNGDGRADKFTVFAENLNMPSSLAFANGGVIVAAQPNFLFLKDTNGDDKADSRQVLNSGWGIRDTHAGPSNLQYAPDNRVWGVVGYSGYDGIMNGKPMQFTQGPYRFKPDGSEFEYLTMSTNNTWGLGFSETFDVFGSTANNDQSLYLAIPNRYFADIEGLPGGGRGAGGPGYQSAAAFYGVHPTTPYIRQVDVFGGYTAAAGHYLYTARAFPKWSWNRIAFITEPTAHLVGQAVIEKDGAGFVTRDGWNLLSSAEEWFAPIAAMTGPDGAVWVTDWYNFIQQHNPTPVGFSVGRGAAYETSHARQAARPDLPRRVQGRAGGEETVALEGRHRGSARGALFRQHAVAAPRAAPDRRARPEGRRSAARRDGAQQVSRRDRHERRRHARAVGAPRAGGDELGVLAGVRRGGRGAEAPGRGRAQGCRNGPAGGCILGPADPRLGPAAGSRSAHPSRRGPGRR